MFKFLLIAFCILMASGASPAAYANDSEAARVAAARRYAKTFDFVKMTEDALATQLGHLSGNERRQAESLITRIDIRAIEAVFMNALVEIYTTAELNALADFYGSPEGQAVLKKTPQFFGRVNPAIMAIIMRAIYPEEPAPAENPA